MRNLSIIAVVLAVATTAWTWWPRQEQVMQGPVIDETKLLTESGEKVDPQQVASLRVATYSATDNAPSVFEVARKGEEWVIPSHFDYPADGGTRVGNTAGTVLNLPTGPVVESDPAMHDALGVIDPLTPGLAGVAGTGKRVTLRDEGGQVLVDIIIGNKAQHANVYYVRKANDDKVYSISMSPDIRTTFRDWVQTDLLEVNAGDVRSVLILDQSVDETRGVLQERSETRFARGDSSEEWMTTTTPPGKVVNQETVNALVTEATTLRLSGVRPYSDMWLQARGFYISDNGTLLGNEGSIQVATNDGIIYHMFFGEIALGDEDDTQAEVDSSKLQAANESDSHNRYMAIFVQYQPSQDSTIPAPQFAEPAEGESLDPNNMPQPSNLAEIQKAQQAGVERARKAQRKFGRFFYVITNDSFKKLRPPVSELFKVPDPEGDNS